MLQIGIRHDTTPTATTSIRRCIISISSLFSLFPFLPFHFPLSSFHSLHDLAAMKSSIFLTIASATTAWTSLFNIDSVHGTLDDWKALLPNVERRHALTAHVEKRQTSWAVGQTVNTTSGPVTGQAGKSADGVSEYLGIPFAQPPTGDLRFAAPVKFAGTNPINGTTFVGSLYPLKQRIPC